MKSFTDLEQSRKLAEILPLETADLWYAETYEGKIEGWDYIVSDTSYYCISFIKPSENNYSQNTVKDIPCWSLAALLDVLPMIKKCEDIANPFIAKTPDGEYYIVYATLTKEVYDSSMYDNPIDACYKMIVKLKEEGLI